MGGLVYFDRQAKNSALGASLAGSRSQLLESLKESIASFRDSPEGLVLQSNKSDSMLRMDLILSHVLNFSEKKTQLCTYLLSPPNAEQESLETVPSLFCQTTESDASESLALDSDVEERLRDNYDWLGELAIQTYGETTPNLLSTHSDLLDELQQTFFGFLIALFIGFPLLFLSAVSSLVLFYRLIAKKAKMRFGPSEIPAYLLIEVFTLYLLGMLCLPKIVDFFGVADSANNLLLVNILGISSILLVGLWPLTEGYSLRKVADSIGMQWRGFSQSLRNLLFAPYAYLSSLAPFLLMLVLYSLTLTALGVDPSSGAHPVVPLLAKSENSNLILLVVLMAVVVAPVIEEIMFRGYFYTWMRMYLHPVLAIPLSSFVFAALHPQGVVGLVPLTCIGMILALIREWRNSLLTCMLTHAIFNAVTLSLVVSMFGAK